jgi:hypothetical protein
MFLKVLNIFFFVFYIYQILFLILFIKQQMSGVIKLWRNMVAMGCDPEDMPFRFTRRLACRPHSIDSDGNFLYGNFTELYYTYVINDLKRDAAVTLYLCLRQLWVKQFGPGSFDPRFFRDLCKKYVMINLRFGHCWEHLIKEPFVTPSGRKDFERLVKMKQEAEESRRLYINAMKHELQDNNFYEKHAILDEAKFKRELKRIKKENE